MAKVTKKNIGINLTEEKLTMPVGNTGREVVIDMSDVSIQKNIIMLRKKFQEPKFLEDMFADRSKAIDAMEDLDEKDLATVELLEDMTRLILDEIDKTFKSNISEAVWGTKIPTFPAIEEFIACLNEGVVDYIKTKKKNKAVKYNSERNGSAGFRNIADR